MTKTNQVKSQIMYCVAKFHLKHRLLLCASNAGHSDQSKRYTHTTHAMLHFSI